MQPPTHEITVDGVGRFVFARRTMRNSMAILAKASDLRHGVPADALDAETAAVIDALATLPVLTLEAPGGWNPEAADPFDPSSYSDIFRVWEALRTAEETFRKGPGEAVQTAGA